MCFIVIWKTSICQWTLTIQCWFWSFCDTSYFFSVFVVAKSHVCITRTLFCCKNFWWVCLTILDCIFVCNLNRRVRLVILNLFAVLWKEHRNIKILDVTPFLEGWLIRPGKCVSIRLFRQTTVVYPHRQLFLCDEKILREMMLKLNDVCECDEQLSWNFFGVRLLF